MKKTWTVRNHARIRARQRYDADITSKQLIELATQIKDGNAVKIKDQGNQMSLWHVLPEWSEEPIPVVFCGRRNEVVTFLPRNALAVRGA